MNTYGGALVIFVKTPGLSPLKTRLAASLGVDGTMKFYQASLLATAAVAKKLSSEKPGLCVYWAVAEPQAVNLAQWQQFPTVWQGDGDLGDRLAHVYAQMLVRHSYVCFMGADSPHVEVKDLSTGIARVQESCAQKFVLGPTEDGGFYFFGSGIALPKSVWIDVAYSSGTTLAELKDGLLPFGQVEYIAPNFDIDTVEDLNRYASLNMEHLHLLPEQKSLMLQDFKG